MGEQLRDAAARGDLDQVVKLLGEGVKPTLDEGGRNALHLAAAGGHADVVAALIFSRWDVNAQDSAGYTPIQRAAVDGHLEVIKQLIKHGANVNIQDKVHGNTALHEASWKGYSQCVEVICQAKDANLQIKNFGGFAPLHLACQNGHNQSCRELLMANCNPNIQNNYGDTPLHTSARYGHAGVTRILISAECHMSDQNKNGDTALHITSAMGRRKLTRILLEAGCDPNRRNKQSERARDIAIRKDLNEIVDIIDKTVPLKHKERQNEGKKDKEKISGNDKKRGKNESGSSKESSTQAKEKKKHKNEHQVHFNRGVDTKWSPYGCHYYPDPKTFPKPKLDSLPQEPLRKGEQYYLDLAGNIRKGPVGVGYTCYCAPFFKHMEERLDRDKRELKEHIDAAHIRLDRKVTNLEAKTRGQLNEITRSMALERFKCQQRHVHLEQWLIRGTIFRNSERTRPTDVSSVPLAKSRSLENILEEKMPSSHQSNHHSVEMLYDDFKSNREFIIPDDDLKNRSSSREGKESGKGSSEVVGLGTSEGEDDPPSDTKRLNALAQDHLTKRIKETDNQDRRLGRSTREISERIDEVLKNGENLDKMDVLYNEMMKWRSYHSGGKVQGYKEPNLRLNDDGKTKGIEENSLRHSYHDPLSDGHSGEGVIPDRIRASSDPRRSIEEPERKSVLEIVAKLQKQQAVQELVAKIHRKTGLIHKSAQKWKENKTKIKEKENCLGKFYADAGNKLGDSQQDKTPPPNYENIRQWDVQQGDLSQLPYRCRSGIYSSTPDQEEYQRNLYRLHLDSETAKDDVFLEQGYSGRTYGSSANPYYEREGYDDNFIGSSHEAEDQLYRMSRGEPILDDSPLELGPRNLRKTLNQTHPSYSPTQNDSGYSTKPYGGSSTGPSPSLSGQEYETGPIEMNMPPPLPTRKRLEPPSSSLV